MRTIKLEINDNIYDKVMFFLTKLPKNDIRVNIENKDRKQKTNILKAVSLKTKGFKFDREEASAR